MINANEARRLTIMATKPFVNLESQIREAANKGESSVQAFCIDSDFSQSEITSILLKLGFTVSFDPDNVWMTVSWKSQLLVK